MFFDFLCDSVSLWLCGERIQNLRPDTWKATVRYSKQARLSVQQGESTSSTLHQGP